MRKFLHLFVCLSLLVMNHAVFANVVGTDFQIFNPTNDGDQYFTVHSSKTLMRGQFNFGLFVDGAMNTLPENAGTDGPDSGRRIGYQDFIISTVAHFGYGILKGWDIGFSVPFIMQTIKEEAGKVSFDAEGVTEYRINTKIRLLGTAKNGVALVGTASLNQIESNPYMGDEDSYGSYDAVNYHGELVGSFQLGDSMDMALNVGYRSRNPGNTLYPAFPVDPIGDQITASTAMGWQISKRWRFITEVYGAYTLDEFRSDLYTEQNPAEVILGLKYRPVAYLYLYAGVGSEILHATGTPDARAFVGVNWSPLVFGKKKREKEPEPVPEPTPEPEAVAEETPTDLPVEPEAPTEQIVVENIYFKTGSYTQVKSNSTAEIAKVANYLKSISFDRLVIAGHTDSVGNDSSNMLLSQRRAETIKKILIGKYGIPADKITSEGFGETKPIDDNSTEQGREKNRRVEFNVFSSANKPAAKPKPGDSTIEEDSSPLPDESTSGKSDDSVDLKDTSDSYDAEPESPAADEPQPDESLDNDAAP